MRDFPWLEAALFIALAVALIVRPNRVQTTTAAADQSDVVSIAQ